MTEHDKFEADLTVERAGFTKARTAALKARPMIGSLAEADAVVNKPHRRHWTESEAPGSPRMEALRKAREMSPLIAEARMQASINAVKAQVDAT